MVATILSAFTVPEIRKKLAFTALLLALYRLGAHIPVPGVNINAVRDIQEQFGGGGILNLLNTFSGGGLGRIAVFALGIMPYITASIILQLLTVVVPSLEKLSKEGEVGQARITQYTRYLTVGLVVRPGDRLRLPVPLLRGQRRPAGDRRLRRRDAVPDRHGPHRRLRDGHVDGRADHPARHRQRHLADDLRLDRLRPAERRLRPGGRTPIRSSS